MNRVGPIALAALCVAAPARAEERRATPDDYLEVVAAASPGDVVRFAPGRYTRCLHIDGVHGAPQARLVLQGPLEGPPAVFVGSGCVRPDEPRRSVMVMLEDASFVTLRDLELDAEGAAVSGVRGGFGATPVHDIVLERLFIHDNDVSNQPSGISSFATAWRWTIRECRIERTGLGLYLGDSDGGDPFIAGTIEHNVVVNPRGYGMQIKHQRHRLDVPGLPAGDSVTYIRHNVFIKSDNAATGDRARPNLLVGAFPPTGTGVEDRYEIYGNVLFDNASDVEPLFQGEGNLAFHDNLLVNSFRGTGILIRPHNGAPRRIDVYRNTILTEGVGISVTTAQDTLRARVVANAVFGNGMPLVEADDEASNVTGGALAADALFADATRRLGRLDLHPLESAAERLRGPVADEAAWAGYADADLDFDGRPRTGAWRGAYAGPGVGWSPAATPKPRPRPTSSDDAGAPTDADGGEAVGERDASAPPGAADEGNLTDGRGCLCARGAKSPAAGWLIIGLVLGAYVHGRRRST